MRGVWLIALTTYKEGIRNRILLGIFFCALILCAFNLIFTDMFSHELSKVAVDVGLSVVSLSGLLTIFFMGMNLMAKDMDKRTIYMVLARPLSRSQYVLGKFIGISLLVLTTVGLLGLVTTGSVKWAMLRAPDFIPPHFSWATFAASLLCQSLSLIVLVSIAILFTVITSSSFMAVLMTIASYLIGQNVESVRRMALQLGSEQVFVVKKLVLFVSWIFPNLEAFDLKTSAAYGLAINMRELAWASLHGTAYAALILLVAVVVFKRKELT